MTAILRGTDVFPAVTENGRYHSRLAALRNVKASGIYAILDIDSTEVLYVGESHSGRLYDTITRHFRKWTLTNDRQGRRSGGTQYDRSTVWIVFAETAPGDAVAAQYAEIQRLGPRDNVVDGETVCCEDIGDIPV